MLETAHSENSLRQLEKLAGSVGVETDTTYETHYFTSQLARYYYTLQIFNHHVPRGSTVDIGAYPFQLFELFSNTHDDLSAVDLHPEKLPPEMDKFRDKITQWDIENEPSPAEWSHKFDNVILLEVVEHLHVNPLNLFKELNQIMKPGGVLFLSTPNLLSLGNRLKMLFGKPFLEHPFSVYEKLERHGSRGHQRLYSLPELTDILEVYGFDVEKTWIIDNQPPLLSKKHYRNLLGDNFNYELFRSFWKENRSAKGTFRRRIVMRLNSIFSNFYETIYIVAKKSREFDEDEFYKRILASDPFMDPNKFKT